MRRAALRALRFRSRKASAASCVVSCTTVLARLTRRLNTRTPSASSGWAVEYMLQSQYESGTWTHTYLSGEWFYGIEMISSTKGWMAGGKFYNWQSWGVVREYTGSAWNEVYSAVGKSLFGLSMLDESEGWAVGQDGVILHYTSASGDWQEVASPLTETLFSVATVSSTDAWAVGWNGTIAHYTGGAWQAVSSPVTQTLWSIAMVSSDEGWAVGSEGTWVSCHRAKPGPWETTEPSCITESYRRKFSCQRYCAISEQTALRVYNRNNCCAPAAAGERGVYRRRSHL